MNSVDLALLDLDPCWECGSDLEAREITKSNKK
jgi:hypothetical protein